jgi:hypothetical protein
MFCIVAWKGGYNEPCVKNLDSCITQRSWAIVPSNGQLLCTLQNE